MATADDNTDTDGGVDGPLHRVTARVINALLVVRGSFLLFIAVVGIVLELAGLLLFDGTLAGMFGIWGATAFVYAAVGFVFLRLIGYN